MRRVLNSDNDVFRIYKTGFSSNTNQPPVLKEVKISVKPEPEKPNFAQMLETELQALTE